MEVQTNQVCKAVLCVCSQSNEECSCIPSSGDDRARCVECNARMVVIDLATGLPVEVS